MPKIKLSDAKIKTLKPQEKAYRILDGERLYIEVRPSGAKVWRLKFILNGKEGSISLGEYPAVSLAEARGLKDEAKSKIAKGINPVRDKREQRKKDQEGNKNTFEDITHEYIKERLANKTEKYREQFIVAMQKDVFNIIGDKDVKEVTSADILQIIKNTMKRVRSQKNHGTGEVTAIQNRKFIGAVMRYAIATLKAENDPTYAVRDVVVRPDINHARPLTKNEKEHLISKLKEYSGSETVRNAGLFLLYTMLRTIEIRRLEWKWVDFNEEIITFPKAAMKKGRAHVVPMSAQVLDILKKQYLNSGLKQHVFPAVYKDGMLSATTLNRMLDFIGLSDVTAHDFRATASTSLYEKGYKEDHIELQLAHSDDNKTKASYNHAKHINERKNMLQDWADIVDSWSE